MSPNPSRRSDPSSPGSILVSSTEPASFKSHLSTSPYPVASSTVPELHGADILLLTPHVRLAFQRKTFPDLLNSLFDGRLAKQAGQLTSSPVITHALLLLEGPILWSDTGAALNTPRLFTTSQYHSLLLSLQLASILVLHTSSQLDTANTILSVAAYFSKPAHTSLIIRPKAKSAWGTVTNHDFALHLLQSFPGIGPTTAELIYRSYGLPLSWTVTKEDLLALSGIGAQTAERLLSALTPRDME